MRLGAFWRRVFRAAQLSDAIDEGRARQAHRAASPAGRRPLLGMLLACVCLTLAAVALASAQTSRPATAPASDDVDPLNATRYAELSDAEAWSLARRVLPEDTDAAPLEARRDAVKARASTRAAAGAAKTKPGAPLAGDVDYLSDHSAVVRSAQPGKPGTFVASAAPLRAEDPEGRLRPVVLRL